MYVRTYAKRRPLGSEEKSTEKHLGGNGGFQQDPSGFDSGSGGNDEEEEDDETWEKRTFALNDADNDFSFTMDAMQCLQVEVLPNSNLLHHAFGIL